MTKTILILAIALSFVAVTLTTATIVTAQSDTVIACVNTKSKGKNLRIVDSADDCRNRETPLQWNTEGPPGATGMTGMTGIDGAPGATGMTGMTGMDGADGAPSPFELVITERSADFTMPPKSLTPKSVNCEDDEVVTGGGYFVEDFPFLNVWRNQPATNGWSVAVSKFGDTEQGGSVHALCALK